MPDIKSRAHNCSFYFGRFEKPIPLSSEGVRSFASQVNQDSVKKDCYEDKEAMGESLDIKPMMRERRKNEGCRF
jgi:hypothetical protein